MSAVGRRRQGVPRARVGTLAQRHQAPVDRPPDVARRDADARRRANGFRFLQRQNDLDVAIETDNEFAITEIRVVAVDRTSSLKPILEKTPAGLVLKGYTASSQRPDGSNTTVQAALEYETVSGLRMLHKVNLDMVFQGASAKFEWVFTDYQIKLR